jgi:DhnA family fructose-bisphosphate aldolase class Ia
LLYSVEDALRLGADAVGCMGFPGSAFEGEALPYLAELVAQAATWNVPVMAEMLPGGFENPKVTWTPQGIADAARIGGEMGADFVKTAYTGDEDSFRRVVEGVPVPVLVLGGGKADDPRELLEDVHGALRAGARGAVVGRNVWQHPAPERMAAALAALIHDGADVDEALGLL